MKRVWILPTGDEIRDGIVLDLDSAEILRQVVQAFPCAEVTRVGPVADAEDAIIQKISQVAAERPGLIVLIGGSGGGHRFSQTLGKDFTHSALERFLDSAASREIYGKNGHLWTKLLCGRKGDTYFINVPGPFVEAKAAMAAFLDTLRQNGDVDALCLAMAQAVYKQYPTGAAEEIL